MTREQEEELLREERPCKSYASDTPFTDAQISICGTVSQVQQHVNADIVRDMERALRNLIDAIPEETLQQDPPLREWVRLAEEAITP